MSIRHILGRGIGFAPGSVRTIVTHGFAIGEAAPEPEPPTVRYRSALVDPDTLLILPLLFLSV
jgi:hypothetical protein